MDFAKTDDSQYLTRFIFDDQLYDWSRDDGKLEKNTGGSVGQLEDQRFAFRSWERSEKAFSPFREWIFSCQLRLRFPAVGVQLAQIVYNRGER
jgi:hypothetical protein